MGRDWDQEYNRNDYKDINGLEDIPFTGKKKTKVKRQFVIEYKYHSNIFTWSHYWKVFGKYKTEDSARKAFSHLQKNRHGHAPIKIQVYKTKSTPNELSRFGVIVNGDLYEEYRLIKKD